MMEDKSIDVSEQNGIALYYIMSKKTLDKYEINETKKNVNKLLSDYKQAKFEYLVSNSVLEKLTSTLEPKYAQKSNIPYDSIGENITKKIDSERFIEYYDEIFNSLYSMLSSQEKKYYNLCLINNYSEQTLSDILGISRTGLQPIKNNCIIKIALAFHIAVLK